MPDKRQREIPAVFSPVAVQVGLNMALNGSLTGEVAELVLAEADSINADFDEWLRLALANAAMSRAPSNWVDTSAVVPNVEHGPDTCAACAATEADDPAGLQIPTDYNGVHEAPTISGTSVTRRAD